MKSICVFCGSRPGADPVYAEAARGLGELFAEQGIRLVFGGGHVGLMGVVASAVLRGGGEVIGVIPQALVNRELAHPGVADMRIVETMHQRKALMSELSDGFVALPGGLGTYEELFEVLTWAQLGFQKKPIALINAGGYYDPLIEMIDRTVSEEFMNADNRKLLVVANHVEELIQTGWLDSASVDRTPPGGELI